MTEPALLAAMGKMRAQRQAWAAGLLVFALLVVAVAVPAMARHNPDRVTVTAVGENSDEFAFDPENPSITAGDNVLFVNDSTAQHTFTSDQPGLFESGVVLPGGERVVNTERLAPGVPYGFFCAIHPLIMTGTLTVGP